MALNYIWIAFFLIAATVAAVRLLVFGDVDVFPAIMDSTFANAKTAFEISIGLTGVLSLWMGIMKIGERGGVVDALARWLSPLFRRLFPEIPAGHPVFGNIFMNISANMLGLDNAATPLGLKAMEGLQQLNTQKERASNAMIMFLVLNTSGLTIIPVSILTYRAQMGAAQPTDVFIPPCWPPWHPPWWVLPSPGWCSASTFGTSLFSSHWAACACLWRASAGRHRRWIATR